jgi:hypothetical protein
MNTTTYEPGLPESAAWRQADLPTLLARLELVYRSLGLAPELARKATRADAKHLGRADETLPESL